MNQQFTVIQDDLILLSESLGEGLEINWNHEIRKQILLILHRLKSLSRKLNQSNIENELVAIESSLGYGSGSAILPDAITIEEHQFRLLELSEEFSINDVVTESEAEPEIKNSSSALSDEDGVELESSQIQLILCNCSGRDKAREIAHGLVKTRLAACVNIIANIGSIYWWKGEIRDTAECQLQIKTTSNRTEEVISYIKNQVDEQTPEILAFPVEMGNEDYFNWVKQETKD